VANCASIFKPVSKPFCESAKVLHPLLKKYSKRL
jgi:hypothetical protein